MRVLKDPEKRLLRAVDHTVKNTVTYRRPEDLAVTPEIFADIWICVSKEDLAELKEALANYKLWKAGQ